MEDTFREALEMLKEWRIRQYSFRNFVIISCSVCRTDCLSYYEYRIFGGVLPGSSLPSCAYLLSTLLTHFFSLIEKAMTINENIQYLVRIFSLSLS